MLAHCSASVMSRATTSITGFTRGAPVVAAHWSASSRLRSSRVVPSSSFVTGSCLSSRRPTITGVFTYFPAIAAASGYRKMIWSSGVDLYGVAVSPTSAQGSSSRTAAENCGP